MRILSVVIKLLAAAAQCQNRHGCRTLWLLDEFQRIERAGRAALQEINTGLHSLFNACPNNFSLFLSFSGRPERSNLPAWFTDELRDRIGRTKVMVLPPLQPSEAMMFVKEILAHARSSDRSPKNPYFPFHKDACEAIIAEIGAKEELKPRAIMHAFNAVLQEAEPRIPADIPSISCECAKRILSEYMLLQESDDAYAQGESTPEPGSRRNL